MNYILQIFRYIIFFLKKKNLRTTRISFLQILILLLLTTFTLEIHLNVSKTWRVKNIRYLNANILHSLQIAKPNPPFHSHKPNIFSLNHEQQLVKINQHWTHTRQKKKRKNSKPTAAINFLINTCKYLIITYYFCNKQMSSIPSADY